MIKYSSIDKHFVISQVLIVEPTHKDKNELFIDFVVRIRQVLRQVKD